MKRSKLEKEVTRMMAEHFGVPVDFVHPDTHMQTDLGGDSLDAIEFIMEVEDHYQVAIPDSDIEHAMTVNEFVDYLMDKHPDLR